jgi:hypothetical protein
MADLYEKVAAHEFLLKAVLLHLVFELNALP